VVYLNLLYEVEESLQDDVAVPVRVS